VFLGAGGEGKSWWGSLQIFLASSVNHKSCRFLNRCAFVDTWEDHQQALLAFPAYSSAVNPAERLWHERLGHLNPQNMQKLLKMSTGIDLTHIPDLVDCTCEACLRARINDVPHRESLIDKNAKPWEVIFSDVKGPLPVDGYNGSKFFVTFEDSATRYSKVFLMKYKSEVPGFFRQFKAKIERRGNLILQLHSDGGGEYLGTDFQRDLANEGIAFTYSTPESQQQNGISERLNQTLLTKAYIYMKASELPSNLWPEAIKHANSICNISPVESSPNKTPYKIVTGKIPDFSYMRKFGCDFWYRPGSQKKYRSLLDEKGVPGSFVGFDSRHIVRVRDKKTGRIVRATVVYYQESVSTIPGGAKRRRLDFLCEDGDNPDDVDDPTSAAW
jgi:hypothetical protein